jgi:hypothetical protein
MRIQSLIMLSAMVLMAMAGCSKPAEAPAEPATPDTEAAVPTEAPVSAPESAPAVAESESAAETAAVVLPEGFKALYHVHPDMTLTSVETVNAETGEYKVSGELRIGPGALLNYYVKYFQDNGWEEDMVMEQEGTVVVSFKKDGHLQYIDAREGGIGMKIDITTGQG